MSGLIITISLFLSYLIYERFRLNKYISEIPLRIAVTGTRGKTAVVLMLASVFREEGRSVLAKTTGSTAQFVMPDGKANDIPSRGSPSILEQKRVLKKAYELRAEILVAEIMSIHPENHYTESQQILRPNIVVITNTRADHPEAWGSSSSAVSNVLLQDIPENCIVFIPESESSDLIRDTVKRRNGKLFETPASIPTDNAGMDTNSGGRFFPANTDLV